MNPASFRSGLVILFSLCLLPDCWAKPRLFIVRGLPGSSYTVPVDVSADGGAIAASSYSKDGFVQAFHQERPGHSRLLRTTFPVESGAIALSANGSVFLGYSYNASGVPIAFRWTQQDGAVALAADPGSSVFASALSGDGQLVIGVWDGPLNGRSPFFWTAPNGIQPLSLTGFSDGYPSAADYDGSVIVGSVRSNLSSPVFACRWVNQGEPHLLLPTTGKSQATATTPDGNIIIGVSTDVFGHTRGFRWHQLHGAESIGDAGAYIDMYLTDISADGEILVGNGWLGLDDYDGLQWTAAHGLRNLNEVYGAVVPRGSRIIDATAISADGRWITGMLRNTAGEISGYILDTARTTIDTFARKPYHDPSWIIYHADGRMDRAGRAAATRFQKPSATPSQNRTLDPPPFLPFFLHKILSLLLILSHPSCLGTLNAAGVSA